jgi:hypothetical protein
MCFKKSYLRTTTTDPNEDILKKSLILHSGFSNVPKKGVKAFSWFSLNSATMFAPHDMGPRQHILKKTSGFGGRLKPHSKPIGKNADLRLLKRLEYLEHFLALPKLTLTKQQQQQQRQRSNL